MLLKIFGERHTGTKYAQKLIELNFDGVNVIEGRGLDVFEKIPSKRVASLLYDAYFRLTYNTEFGWKHAAAPSREFLDTYLEEGCLEPTEFICLVRDPYSWLLSMHKQPYEKWDTLPRRFEDFLITPWKANDRDSCLDVQSPMELWNVKNQSYLDSGFSLFSFENLVVHPDRFLFRLAESINWGKKMFVDWENSTVAGSKQKSSEYKTYYAQEGWTRLLSRRAVEIINTGIDWGLAKEIGYMRR